MLRRAVVVVLALVALAGGWRIWDAFTPQVDCRDFANQGEVQVHLQRALHRPTSVGFDFTYGARNPK